MWSIACFLFDLKGVLYVIENIIHFKKSTKSSPELKIYLIWSICIKKLNKVFSDKITSPGSLHFSTLHYISIVSLPVCKNFFHLKSDCRRYIFFSEITRTHTPAPPLPPIKSQMVGHLVGHFRKLLGSFFGWEVSSAFKQTKLKLMILNFDRCRPYVRRSGVSFFGLQVTLVEPDWSTVLFVVRTWFGIYGKY